MRNSSFGEVTNLQPVKLGLYQHYKGEYVIVTGTRTLEEDEKQLVDYYEVGSKQQWARRYDIFYQSVRVIAIPNASSLSDTEVQPTLVPRFRYIGEI